MTLPEKIALDNEYILSVNYIAAYIKKFPLPPAPGYDTITPEYTCAVYY